MHKADVGLHIVVIGGLLLLAGCEAETHNVGLMRSQSGEYVEVYQDSVDHNIFGSENVGDPYYLENGAKVRVNEGDGTRAPDRSTNWNRDN